MDALDLPQLRRLLRWLREPAPAPEAERRVLAALRRIFGGQAGQAEDRGRAEPRDCS